MASTEITRVVTLGNREMALDGYAIDAPKPGDRISTPSLEVVGWVLGKTDDSLGVEAICDGVVLARGNIGRERPDVAATFPFSHHARAAGFSLTVRGVALRHLNLQIVAVLPGHRRLAIAAIDAEPRCTTTDSDIGPALVSVIIPCHNQSRFLSDAIESVLAQTYPHVEIVVVDDGSHDNTLRIAERYPAVRYVRQACRGVAAARNVGMSQSQGTYAVFLDADDRLLPRALEAGVAGLQGDPRCAFVSGACRHVNFAGAVLPPEPIAAVVDDSYTALLRNCYVWMPGAVMFQRLSFLAAGGFDTSFASSADHELYMRMARRYRVGRHNQLVAEYRRHGTNMTRNPGANLRDRVRALRAQRPYLPANRVARKAYTEGLMFARHYYGEPLITDVLNAVWMRQWRDVLSGFRILLRYHPAGAVVVVWRALRM